MSNEVLITGHSGVGQSVKVVRAKLGEHIRSNPHPIAKHSLRTLAVLSEDAAAIAESVALADRLLTRRRAERWSRHIELTIPVCEPSAFSPQVVDALVDALSFLTGDDWSFNFVLRSNIPPRQGYLPLVERQPEYLVPYSDGLDSFAQSRLLCADHGKDAVLNVRAGTLQSGAETASLLSIPRRFHAGHPREKTYRTRPFVYFSMVGIAAATLGVKAVVIGENGQGALGPSFAKFGNEWPFRSAHPGFVSRLQKYLTLLFNVPVRFDQPQLWRTKAEVLAELRERGLLAGWEATTSCSARPLQKGGHSACGVCGGCVLRRVALRASAITSNYGSAFEFGSPQLTIATLAGDAKPMSPNTREILTRAALSMEHFALLCDRGDHSQIVAREVRDIPHSDPFDTAERVVRLSRKHAAEWYSLLESLPQDAWLRRQFSHP